jgi:HAD superfamily hydrolase (TIGR01509 family)
VPDFAETTSDAAPSGGSTRPIDAVLFDFHGTLCQVEDSLAWVRAAAAECGASVTETQLTVGAVGRLPAGGAGGPLPARVPPHLIEVWASRDLYEYAHRAAFTGTAGTVVGDVDGFADALYERLLRPDGWVPYADAAPTVAALVDAGVRVGVLSNIGFDIRPHLRAFGLDALLDACTLSYECGRVKPDPAIFQAACRSLGTDPANVLVVGDTPADAAAVAVGCAAYVVPAAPPGAANNLAAACVLAGVKNGS